MGQLVCGLNCLRGQRDLSRRDLFFDHRGFQDEIVLLSDTEPDRALGISFWDTKEDAELYHREQFPKIQDSIRHLLDGEPIVRTFNVLSYVGKKIGVRKAA